MNRRMRCGPGPGSGPAARGRAHVLAVRSPGGVQAFMLGRIPAAGFGRRPPMEAPPCPISAGLAVPHSAALAARLPVDGASLVPAGVRGWRRNADWPCRRSVRPWRQPGGDGPNRPACSGKSGKRRRGLPPRAGPRHPCLTAPTGLAFPAKSNRHPAPLVPHHAIGRRGRNPASARGRITTPGRSSPNCDTIPPHPQL